MLSELIYILECPIFFNEMGFYGVYINVLNI